MDHIFGSSQDIVFGGKPEMPLSDVHSLQKTASAAPKDFSQPRRERSPVHENALKSEQKRSNSVPFVPEEKDSLLSLISNMKPSFLPKETLGNDSMKVIALSPSSVTDPLFLCIAGDGVLLLGSGFSELIKAGKMYKTFPDMRLIFSLKERIRAWVLTDSNIDISLLFVLLPTLGFPPIYATRDIIAKFRDNVEFAEMREKCRFFEIFPEGLSERRISEFELSIGSVGGLSLRSSGSTLYFPEKTLPPSLAFPVGIETIKISSTQNAFIIGEQSMLPGEIFTLDGVNLSKNAFKYTFDSFFIDGQTIGVVAGYTLSDRELLSENGVLMFTLEEDPKQRGIKGHIFIDSRGFVHTHEMMRVHKEIIKGIRSTYESLVLANPKIDRSELLQGMRREITKYCYLLTGRTPIVMPIIIERPIHS